MSNSDNVMVFPGSKSSGQKQVLHMARKLSATIGSEFFAVMAKHLTRELSADAVYIGEFTSGQLERIQPLASYLDGQHDYSAYPLAGSAASQILLGRRCMCRAGAQKRHPSDELLAKVRATAFVGVPLADSNGSPLGFMMAIYRSPGANLGLAKTALEIFAPRASSELVRKQREERIRESEQRYKAFISKNLDAMWRIEFEHPIPTSLPEEQQLEQIYQYGYLAECNDALARMLGVDKTEQLIGSKLEVFAPLSNESVREATLRAIRAGYRFTTVETTPLDANGKHRYMLRSQCGIVDDGMLWRLWGITRDVTELKHSELELDASEQRMADLLEAVHLAVIMLDLDGAIVYCNDYFHRLTGWKPSDVRGQNWLDLMIPADESGRLRNAFAEAKAGLRVPLHFESSVRGPDGRRWWMAWDTTFLRSAQGPAAVVNVGRDITEHRVLEAQFRQAQKLESIGRLASGLAHDFNNLLTIIRGYSDLLLQGRDPADPAYAGLAEIKKSSERGAELTHQLLAFSRRQLLKPEILNLNSLVSETERMLGRLIGSDIRLQSVQDPELGCVHADAGQIHQILLNLAVNARDAMPKGGDLTIETSNLDVTASKSVYGLTPGRYVQLAITDSGAGISEEVRSHLFEPFFTTKDAGKGTGLGLSVVYGIVRQSGGQIFVESIVNKGTSVRIFLPRLEAGQTPEPKAETATTRETPLARGSETVLVVDDHENVRIVTAGIVRDLGYHVLEAGTPTQAMKIASQEANIDLLLTDMVMPEMGGPELATVIKETHPRIKVVFMSGYVDLPIVARRGSDPDVEYLQKPFNANTLATLLRKTLDI